MFFSFLSDGCQDEDMMMLEKRCRNLERNNQQLFTDVQFQI